MVRTRDVETAGRGPGSGGRVVELGSAQHTCRHRRPKNAQPPAIKTLPFGNSVAVCPARPWTKSPVVLHVPVVGSYSCAPRGVVVVVPTPPTTSTRPLGSSVAVCPLRPLEPPVVVTNPPVALHVPVDLAADLGFA